MPSPEAPSARGPSAITFAALVFLGTCTVVLSAFLLLGDRPPPWTSRDNQPRFSPAEAARVALFQRAAPSVVHVRWKGKEYSPLEPTPPGDRTESGSGAGIVWNDRGYIVTNMHVVNTRGGAQVTLYDGSIWEAVLVGFEPSLDLAVLAIAAPSKRLVPITLGDSARLLVGQDAYAIGTPFGLEWTLTTGVVSGLNRPINGYNDVEIKGMIQTDAAINPGNSGGALLDSHGHMVGLITGIISSSTTDAGVGFAIPVDKIAENVPQILEWGFQLWAELGLVLGSDGFSASCFARILGDTAPSTGVVIVEVLPSGPAQRAGLRQAEIGPNMGAGRLGDVIVGVDGVPVSARKDLEAVLRSKSPGDTVQLDLLRGDEPMQSTLTFEAVE